MNLLITGAWNEAKQNISLLEQIGHRVCFMQQEKDALPCEYNWVEGVICNGLFLHHPIEKFQNLKYIQLTSAGYDRVDLEYIQKHGIEIHNARGVYSIPMAEFALSGVLQLYKQAAFFYENKKMCKWEKHRGLKELFGKKVLIAGCGSVGNECAKRFAAFGCEVTGIDLYPREDMLYKKILPLTELDAQLKGADIVVLTLPLTNQTKYLMNQKRLKTLKKDAVLVNISRGAVIDTAALLEQIDHLGGAVLDVFEEEPLNENSPLWQKEKVILTPHNSFAGEGNSERIKQIIIKNLEEVK